MAWAHQDCDRTLTLGEQRKDYGRHMNEKLREVEEQRQQVEEMAETRAVELEFAHAELKAAQTSWIGLGSLPPDTGMTP